MTETVSVAAICGVPRPSDGCLLNGEPRVYTVLRIYKTLMIFGSNRTRELG